MAKTRFRITLGTVLTLIIVYFIYLYAKERDWTILKYLTGAYIWFWIIIFILPILFLILFLSIFFWKYFSLKRKMRKERSKKVVDVKYRVK